MAEKKHDILTRSYLVFAGFILFALVILGRVTQLQMIEGEYWKSKADSLTLKYNNINPVRGNIYAADGSLLATSIPRYIVHLDMGAPAMQSDLFKEKVDSLSKGLSSLFKDQSAAYYKQLLWQKRRNRERYFLLKRNISYQEQKALKTFPIFRLGKNKGGLILEQMSRRELPFKLLAARTIGYKVDNADVKSVGIERAFDSDLRGTKGKRLMQRIAGGVWKPVNSENEIEPRDGSDVITTIDLNLQDVAENALMEALVAHNARMGCAVLMEVATGHVKAIANLRKGKEEGKYDEDLNLAILQATEPGSTFKLATMMAAIEDGLFDVEDSVDTHGGVVTLAGGKQIRDSHDGGYGRITAKKSFAHSSNVGTIRIAQRAYSKDPKRFLERLNAMHVYSPLGLQIPGEPNIAPRRTDDKLWSAVSLPMLSIGYETRLTPLQILTFYNAVANGGKMVRPLFVKEVRNKGQLIRSYGTEVIAEKICSDRTIAKAKELLVEVVESGTAKHIKHNQYGIAGKTGTAVMHQGDSGYTSAGKKYQASFCGYFPADKPRYSCIVVIYAPSNNAYYAASVACPVFKNIADKVYALDTEMHKPLPELPDTVLLVGPVLKPGRTSTAALSTRMLGMGVPAVEGEWLGRESRNAKPGSVPDVAGMGLRDAIYLLEQSGLQVKPIGRGAVRRQSLKPGTPVLKGSLITIELG